MSPQPTAPSDASWLAAIIASSEDAIISKTLDGVITSWNPAAERIFGYSAADAIGQPMVRLFPADRRDEERAILARISAGESLGTFESVRVRADGVAVDVAVSMSPILNAGGVIVGVSTIARDITQTKVHERELARLTRLYAALSQINQAIVWAPSRAELLQRVCRVFVEDGGFRLAWIGWHNPHTHIFDVTASHGDSAHFLDTIRVRSDDSPEGRGPSGTAFREGRAYVCNDITLDPATLPWREAVLAQGIRAVASLPVRLNGEVTAILSVCAAEPNVFQEREVALLTEAAVDTSFGLDNLERIATLRESEERFRQLAENITEVFWITDPAKGTMLYISPGYEAIWGRPSADLAADPWRWAEALHPDDRERVVHAANTRQTSGDYDETYRIIRPDGGCRWIHDRAFPVRNADGHPYRIVGIAEDVTDQRRLEQEFLHAQRMESVGTLAAGMAHDLNNVFAPILVSITLLQSLVSDERGRAVLRTIEKSAERGADLLRRVLTFARGGGGERVALSPFDVLDEVIRVTRDTFPRSIAVRLDASPELWTISGDATQLHQVFLNLFVNARDAMPQGGALTVTLDNLLVDGTYAAMNPDAREGRYVRVTVADTGHGIPDEIRNRIFDPFFTTKGIGAGTGLGLSTAHAIVRGHGGFLNVYSEVGTGTRFTVYLPAAAGAVDTAEADREAPAADPPRGQGELILVVDDEDGVREITRLTLEAFGYRAILAANGAEAVSLYAKHRHEIALVLTDMAMPIMDGAALIAALRSMHADVPVIASSGLAANATVANAIDDGVRAFLHKPYNASAMLTAIAQLLRGDPGPGDR